MFQQILGSGLVTPGSAQSVQITGSLTPDATGIYTENGDTFNSQPVYEHPTNGYFIWYQDAATTRWRITTAVGSSTGSRWATVAGTTEVDDNPYNPQGGAAGVATLTIL